MLFHFVVSGKGIRLVFKCCNAALICSCVQKSLRKIFVKFVIRGASSCSDRSNTLPITSGLVIAGFDSGVTRYMSVVRAFKTVCSLQESRRDAIACTPPIDKM